MRVEQALDVRALVLERRLLEHQVALLHRRAQDHVAPDADERRLRPRLQRRHLDDEVLARRRPAGEPPAVAQLVGAERARVDRGRPARRPRRSAPCTSCTCRGRRTSSRSRCRSSSRRRRSACRSARAPRRRRAGSAAGRARRRRRRAGASVGSLASRRAAAAAAAHDGVAAAFAAASRARCAAIQRAPHASWPSSRSAARTLSTTDRRGAHDRARQPGGHRHRQEGGVQRVAAAAGRTRRSRRPGTCSRRARRGSAGSSRA